jgi:hypothetical protein
MITRFQPIQQHIPSFCAIRELLGWFVGWLVLCFFCPGLLTCPVQCPLSHSGKPGLPGRFPIRETLVSQGGFPFGKTWSPRAVSHSGKPGFSRAVSHSGKPGFSRALSHPGKPGFSRALSQSYFPERFSRLSREIASCFWIFTGESTVSLEIR